MKVNKFNANWQLVRVKVKNISNIKEKIDIVKNYLDSNKNIYDKERVLNWTKTIKMSYKDDFKKMLLDDFINYINTLNYTIEDNKSSLKDLTLDDINLIYNDLRKRKYNFQFKKIPKAHIDFIIEIEIEIEKILKGE